MEVFAGKESELVLFSLQNPSIHALTAAHDGTVRLTCAAGDKVGAGTVLATVPA
jgi:predicted deacylase